MPPNSQVLELGTRTDLRGLPRRRRPKPPLRGPVMERLRGRRAPPPRRPARPRGLPPPRETPRPARLPCHRRPPPARPTSCRQQLRSTRVALQAGARSTAGGRSPPSLPSPAAAPPILGLLRPSSVCSSARAPSRAGARRHAPCAGRGISSSIRGVAARRGAVERGAAGRSRCGGAAGRRPRRAPLELSAPSARLGWRVGCRPRATSACAVRTRRAQDLASRSPY
ncbi:hypothetical protein PVAP13_9NG192000 [Panicum virgatum]|uniref:Uncharacterized protein n=1 Tax=Panicum virgatum TaxID=38727 RepID=A0A8T0MHN7_PANVG|nr:hypothetical protein PVAP13_9NG192000 [Panicum virgatum]